MTVAHSIRALCEELHSVELCNICRHVYMYICMSYVLRTQMVICNIPFEYVQVCISLFIAPHPQGAGGT
jgi:hypothetical protein